LQKILIDENLSPSLTADAQQKGFLCSHVNHLGKTGTKDWELKRVILEGDWTFVTNNSIDFRGPANEPGSSGEYADVRRGVESCGKPFRRKKPPPLTIVASTRSSRPAHIDSSDRFRRGHQ
jgi:Domain of unknown function (DUF5615)